MKIIKLFLLAVLSLNSLFLYAQNKVVLIDLQGKNIPFSSLKGKWVFINYWASWCQPCLDEIKQLNYFYKNKPANIALFAVNFDNLSVKENKEIHQQLGILYPGLAKNPAGKLGLGEINGVPVTFVFSPEGKLFDTLYGPQSVASLTRAAQGKHNF